MSAPAASDMGIVRRWAAGSRGGGVLLGPTAAFRSGPDDPYGLAAPGAEAPWNQELPAAHLEVVIELGAGWELDLAGRHVRTRSFTAGLISGPVRTRPLGPAHLVQLSLDPLAAPAVFGVPAGELAADAVDLGAVLGPALSPLEEAVSEAGPSTVAAIDAAEAWVDARVRSADGAGAAVVPADVRRACDLIRASGGRLRVEAVAAELGCSRRHLARRFREYVGASPSEFIRLVRFDRTTTALRRDPSQPLGRLAVACGYADHAHMDREFRVFAARTPRAVAASAVASTPVDAAAGPVPA